MTVGDQGAIGQVDQCPTRNEDSDLYEEMIKLKKKYEEVLSCDNELKPMPGAALGISIHGFTP